MNATVMATLTSLIEELDVFLHFNMLVVGSVRLIRCRRTLFPNPMNENPIGKYPSGMEYPKWLAVTVAVPPDEILPTT